MKTPTEDKNPKPDVTDRQILEILRNNSRISMTELGKRVHLTSQAVKNRLERLNDIGIVQRFTVNVDCPMYGYKTHAIIRLCMESSKQAKLVGVIRQGNCNIMHCYQTTGTQSYFIDGYFSDETDLQAFLEQIQPYGTYDIQIVLNDISLDVE